MADTTTSTPTAKAKLGDVIIGRADNNQLVVGVVSGIAVDKKSITVNPLPLSLTNTVSEGKYVLANGLIPEVKIEEKKNSTGTRTFQQ